MNKRGQVTIFVIIAIILVAVVLALLVYKGPSLFQASELRPEDYLRTCLEQDVKADIAILSDQGGYANPEGFILYNDKKVPYLCYTNQNYKTCIVQQPFVKNKFESELSAMLKPRAEQCFQNLKGEYERRGYSVSALKLDTITSISLKNIEVSFIVPMTITKESSQTFKQFDVTIDSKMYDILFIAQSIVDFENTYGDSETNVYMQYYPDMRVEKMKLDDGTKIYKITNVVTKEYFVFATRSLAWPPGYSQ